MSERPELPELDKMLAVSDSTQPAGVFLEWASCEGVILARHITDAEFEQVLSDYEEIGGHPDEVRRFVELFGPLLVSDHRTIRWWLARWKNIDLEKLDVETEALLNWVHEKNEAQSP